MSAEQLLTLLAEFNGRNHAELATKHRITAIQVYRLVRPITRIPTFPTRPAMPTTAKALFDAAFAGPRDPRSDAYKAGVLAALRYRIDGDRMINPFPPASAESDAWYAGSQEGHALWRGWQKLVADGCHD